MFKRLFDILISSVSLVIFLPLLLILAILTKIKIGSPIIFKQRRPGLNGKIFEIIKFRTMLNEKDSNGSVLTQSQRITSFGHKLRSTSLDELPGLLNVLKGDMSLVGPRPLLPEYLPLYNDEQRKRHDVRPGITGWAQVNGRNAISWEEKFKYDVWYVDNQSFFLDIKILLLTVKKVIFKEDINASVDTTMKKFKGNK